MSNELSMKNIDKYYDLFDEAIMLLYDRLGIDYLQGFIRVFNDISLGQINTHQLADEDVSKLEEIENEIISLDILNEEIRKALLLIIIKGFKHCKMNLDDLSPDYVSFIFAHLIKIISDNRRGMITVLDVNAGVGNLINLILNNLDGNYNFIGIEKEEKVIRIAEAFSSLQLNEISLCLNDCLDNLNICADIIIGDLDCSFQNEKYLPYEIIKKYQNSFLEKNRNDNFMIFMVDNDFFNQKGIEDFKNEFLGTICALIVLPEEFFQNKGKSILIISQKFFEKFETLIINWPKANDSLKVYEVIDKLNNWFKKIK